MNSVLSNGIVLKRPYLLACSAICLKIAVLYGFQACRFFAAHFSGFSRVPNPSWLFSFATRVFKGLTVVSPLLFGLANYSAVA